MKSESLTDEAPTEISLFRSQAVEATRMRFGSPVNAPGLGMWFATGLVLLLLVIAVVFLVSTSFPRKETVSGSLVPSSGLLPVISQRSGVVSKVYVEEGVLVRAGDPIVRVSVDSIIEGGERIGLTLSGIAEGQSQALQRREHATESALLSQEAFARAGIEGLTRQLLALNGSARLYEDQVRLTEATAQELQKLLEDKYVSKLQHREAEARVLTARQNLTETRLRVVDLEQERSRLMHELTRLAAERDASHASSAVERLSAKEREINYKVGTEFELVAQQPGRITSLRAKAGEGVVAGKALGAIMPAESTLLAEVWAPSAAIAFIDVGTEVLLMYDAFPYQKFGLAKARIVKISRSPVVPEELPLDLQAKESRYRVIAELDRQDMAAYGNVVALTPGMRLKADLILERRSLLDWLFEPILASKKRNALESSTK